MKNYLFIRRQILNLLYLNTTIILKWMFQKGGLRISGHNREEAAEERRKLHCEILHNS